MNDYINYEPEAVVWWEWGFLRITDDFFPALTLFALLAVLFWIFVKAVRENT